MMRSLRSRLLAGMIGGIALVLILSGLGVYQTIRLSLVEDFDASLVKTAWALAASVERDDDKIEIEFDAEKLPEFRRSERPSYFQLWLESGMELRRSPSLGKSSLPRFYGDLEATVYQSLTLPSGLAGRAVGIRFAPRDEDPGKQNQREEYAGKRPVRANPEAVIIVMARDTTELEARLAFLRRVLAGAAVGATAVALLIATVVVRRGLRPLNALAERIGGVTVDDLSCRIPAGNMPAEMAPVGDKINDLLSRLEAAFKRERSFTADVAHELRTPLAGIRSTAEVALRRLREDDEYREALSDCLAIAKRLQAMTDSLLMLARLDSKQITPDRQQVGLRDLLESCWSQFSETAGTREITFENNIAPKLSCVSSPEILGMVLRNLLDNAVCYTNEGGAIRAAGLSAESSVEITLANTGCKLSKEAVSRVFDSFWRGDSSRAETGVRCGLGLALVRRLVRVLGGSVSANVDNAGVFAVRVSLPASA